MVYVDSEHRTEYANTLPFDEIDDYPYWAVAYLGEGENGRLISTPDIWDITEYKE